MDIRSGIIESANALGINPADLATIISYETGGTFDPAQAGPVTKYGQHRGLIQFGEPQAQQYGVNWNDPLNSQLGANGAIVRYFRDRGAQPGMTALDLYSIVNAGSPGQYNAVDSGSSVQQKVASPQWAQHAEKATAFLGGQYIPGTPVAGGTAAGDGGPAFVNVPRRGIADELSDAVAFERGNRERRRVSDPLPPTPTVEMDYRSAFAPIGGDAVPVPSVQTPGPELADLFTVKDIGQAAPIDPLTGQRVIFPRRG